MDGATVQPKFNLGFAKSGAHLGTPYSQYRASGSNNPTAAANLIASLNVWGPHADPGLTGKTPFQYDKPVAFAGFDRTGVAVGDYLIGATGTFFVSCVFYPGAPSLFWCNRTMTVTRPDIGAQYIGASPVYSGDTTLQQVPVLAGWPGAEMKISSGTTGRKTGMHLPSDAMLPLGTFMLPATAPLVQFNDVLTDDLGRKWYVQMVESSPLGFCLTAQQVAVGG